MRLAPIRKSQFRALLQSVGFNEDVSRDHVYLTLEVRGQIVARTKVSHGGGNEIPPHLLSEIIRSQIYVNRKEWGQLLAGKLTREQYVRILRSKDKIPTEPKEAKPRGRASRRTSSRRR